MRSPPVMTKSGLRLTISDQGATAIQLRSGKTIAGASVNYDDKTLLTLNYPAKSYSVQPIAQAVRNLARDRKLMLKAHAEVTFKPTLARLLGPATVKRTDLTAIIADQPGGAGKRSLRGYVFDPAPGRPA